MAASSDTPFDRGVRVLVVPGLHGSGPDHWQSWLQRAEPGAVRIRLEDWGHADLDRWAASIDEALHQHCAEAWVAVAHSFGVDEGRLGQALPFASTLVVSANDPWMSHADALYFGHRWGCSIIEAGDAGHINPGSGYGPWPAARQWVAQHAERVAAGLRPRPREAAAVLGFAV